MRRACRCSSDFGEEHIAHRQADPLHLRRQRAADRRARGRISASSGSTRSAAIARRARRTRCGSAGSSPGLSSARRRQTFVRTANRRDFAIPPPEPTMLDRRGGRPAGPTPSARSATSSPTAASRRWPRARTTWRCSTRRSRRSTTAADGDLVFANYVDFDTLWGHRRDVSGYARALEAFDARLPEMLARAAAGRSDDPHRRPRQRPDLSRHRPYPRAGAGPLLSPACRRGRSASSASPTSARPSPRTSASRPAATGGASCDPLEPYAFQCFQMRSRARCPSI